MTENDLKHEIFGRGSSQSWRNIERPGYFGRKRDLKIAQFDKAYGKDNWRLVWVVPDLGGSSANAYGFEAACIGLYEESYYQFFKDRKSDIDFACSFGECIDNGMDNIDSGCDYTIQRSFSTHIQDIALRRVLKRLNRQFEGPKDQILTIRSADSNGYRFGPGNVPFYDPNLIIQPELTPAWAKVGSVESQWQSNKYLQVRWSA